MMALTPDDPGRARNLVIDNRYLHAAMDQAHVRQAFGDVCRRHDALRLVFDSTGLDPVVRVHDDVEPPVEFLDLSHLDEARQRDAIGGLVFGEGRRCFDLRSGPAWHAWFVRLGERTHLLNLCLSHLVADGWSTKVFVNDLMAAYGARARGEPPPRTPAPSFVDLCAIQAQRLHPGPDRLRYWRDRLNPVPERWPFTPRPRPDADLLAWRNIGFSLSRQTALRLREAAWRARTTPFVGMLAAYHLMLSLRTGKERTVVATAALGRPTRSERNAVFACAIYPFVATDTPARASLLDVIRSTHAAVLEATAELLPYKALAAAVNPRFDACRPWPESHLCDGGFYSWAFDEPAVELAGVHITQAPVRAVAPPDYRPMQVAAATPAGLSRAWAVRCGPSLDISTYRDAGSLGFNPDVYASEEMQRFVDQYLWVLETVVWRPDIEVNVLRENHARRFAP